MRAILLLAIVAGLALAGCTNADDAAGTPTPTNETNSTPTPTPTPTPEECGGVQPPVGPCVEPPTA